MTKALEEEDEVRLAVRPMRESDIELITDSWLKSYREGNYGVPHDEYFETQRRVIKALFRTSKVAIACDPDDADQVYGYIVWQPRAAGKSLLHWCFVKQPFRRFGVFRRLLSVADPSGDGLLLTHRSIHHEQLKSAGLNIKYAPFALVTALVGAGAKKES